MVVTASAASLKSIVFRPENDIPFVSDYDDIKAQYALIATSGKRTNAKIEALTQSIKDDAGKEALVQLNAARADYRVPRDKLVEMLKAVRAEEAKNVLLLELRPKQAAYMDRLDALVKFLKTRMGESGDKVNGTFDTATTARGRNDA